MEARLRIHAAIYGVVMTGLVVINVLVNVLTNAWFYWFPFPLVCWGIGLTMHYLHRGPLGRTKDPSAPGER